MKWRSACLELAVIASASLHVAPGAFADESIAISDSPQLFLDGYLIARMENVKRVVQRPEKHPGNPLIVPEHPWEKRILEIYGTVLYDAAVSKYRCWYLANEFKDGIPDTPEHPRTAEYYTCYAESADGVRWEKPMVGAAPFGAHDRHNVVIENTHGFCVLPTPDDPDPLRKYKGAGGAVFGFSPDGIAWDLRNWRDAVGKNDTSTCVVRWKGQYLAYVRAQVDDPQWPAVMRGIGLSTSTDFETWTPKQTVFTTDAEDGYPWTQPYGISVTPYGDVLIGILWLLHLDQADGNNSVGHMDTQLVVSRDGVKWHRVAVRESFLTGTPGSWDEGRVFPGTTMFVRDDRMHIYYTGVGTRHGEGWGAMGVGLATLPVDRFVSIEPADESTPATLTTRPGAFAGTKLIVNADIEGGAIRVEALDDTGNVVPGYEATHSQLSPIDDLRLSVSWDAAGETRTLGDLTAGAPIALRFEMDHSRLFAFQVK